MRERTSRRALARLGRGRRKAVAWLKAPRSTWNERLRRAARHGTFALVATTVLVLGAAAWRGRLTAPDPTLLLRDRHGRFLGEVGAASDGRGGFWPVDELPPRVVAATLAVEDRRFGFHPGIDPVAVVRALRDNLRSGRRVSGASTLAMQVARMQHPGPRSYPRKAFEALTALFMTLGQGREAVLRHYLRIVPYGNQIHGVSFAARRYLDKPVEDLSWAETAFLTSIPQSPARMNPFHPSGRRRAVERGRRILDLLLADGALTATEHALAIRQIEGLVIPPAGERPENALHAVLRLERRLEEPTLRATFAARPVVRTSLDLDIQEEVSWQVHRAVSRWEGQGARNAAAIVVDRRSHEVLAWVGSSDYFDATRAGAIDYTAVSRSPGSALKPFIYALALERGTITPATILDDLERAGGGIGNADGRFLGPLLPRVALANSRNVTAANLLAEVGLDEAYGMLRDLGLHASERPAGDYGLGLSIGALPVTLEALVRAYTALAGTGRIEDLVWFAGQPRAEARRVFSEDTARLVGRFLSDPMARLPSFARMGAVEYPFSVAVKTGTSSRYRDAWTVAYTSRYVVGVWVGDPDFRPMNRLTGYRAAAELVKRILVTLHHDQMQGLDDIPFPPPRGYVPVRLCALSGMEATSACERVFLEWLRPGSAPVDACNVHVRLAVDSRTGQRATPETPRPFVELRAFTDLPPRYASWAAAVGLTRPPDAAGALPGQWARGPDPVRVSVTSPSSDLRLLRDPEAPPGTSTLALRAVVRPPVPQVVWYIDGEPHQIVDYPYETRWKLVPGAHVFQVRLPHEPSRSSPVRVVVE